MRGDGGRRRLSRPPPLLSPPAPACCGRGSPVAPREMTDEAASRGANAVIGVDLDYEVLGDRGSIVMVSANGTAVGVE